MSTPISIACRSDSTEVVCVWTISPALWVSSMIARCAAGENCRKLVRTWPLTP
jgi:hypothetical protein